MVWQILCGPSLSFPYPTPYPQPIPVPIPKSNESETVAKHVLPDLPQVASGIAATYAPRIPWGAALPTLVFFEAKNSNEYTHHRFISQQLIHCI